MERTHGPTSRLYLFIGDMSLFNVKPSKRQVRVRLVSAKVR